MPTYCKHDVPRLSHGQMGKIDYDVMRLVFDLHRERGRLCEESVYQCELAKRLRDSGMDVDSEVPLSLTFGECRIRLRLDLLVESSVVYELKTVDTLSSKHEAQCLTYLYLLNATRGKLVNFRRRAVEARFVNSSRTNQDRSNFELDQQHFQGDATLVDLVGDLVLDWGTGLWTGFYRQAIQANWVDCVPGETRVPVYSNRSQIGYHSFFLLDPETALGVTSYTNPLCERRHYDKLVSATRLGRMHWMNITHGRVRIATIQP